MGSLARQALFISHASPEDNVFTLWLGAKLTALGYEVFADILRLRGSQDWERVLEDAIRNKALKFLLVATPHGVQKQGVRNEITIASDTAKRISDPEFIVPLRLAAYDSPLLIAHAQYIDFGKGWGTGLSELQALLVELRIPQPHNIGNLDLWRGIQLKDARVISSGPERLISHWLAIEAMPDRVTFYDFKGSISHGTALKAIRNSPVPVASLRAVPRIPLWAEALLSS
jgi:TIR domain